MSKEKVEPIPEELGDVTKAPKVSAKQKALNALVRELTMLATQIVLKVATCNCNHKDNCELYKKAKEMANVIDKLQEMRGSVA
jgi:hypothetical protein